MTVDQFITHAIKELKEAGITTARLDCLVIVEDVLVMDRALVLAHPELLLSPAQINTLNNFITQRKKHLPLAYIRGRADFFGRTFTVSNTVLVPRPESESMIDLLKICSLSRVPRIADIGTGSGCLGITAGIEIPGSHIDLYDIDPAVLAVAKQNAHHHHVSARFIESDLLSKLADNTEVVLANLPYVPDSYVINEAAKHEPKLALFAGADGMDLYHTFWNQVRSLDKRPALIITESLYEQHNKNKMLAESANYTLGQTQGLAQLFNLQRY